MRMRVLTKTNKGKLLAIADEVTKLIEADKAADVIPSAYPCDGERLVVIIATAKAEMPEDFCRFVRSLKRAMTANVAFIIDGTPENAAKIVEMAKTGNSKVFEDNILYIDGGLPFKFLSKVSPEEMQKVREWVKEIRANLA
ncbi:MAG: hypothetical protein IJX92_06610 [Clostridia bacterium]|nr:hypothetical protein [Clostridia bacterium]